MVKNIDKKLRNEFTNKIILISGGTGSIGLGLIKQLTKHKPKEIRILSNDENSVAETVANLGQSRIYKFMVGDVRDKDRIHLMLLKLT